MDNPNEIQSVIATKIKERRIALNFSQADVAEFLRQHGLKIHQSAIAKIENGERKLDITTAMRIADVLSLRWDDFYVPEAEATDKVREIGEVASDLRGIANELEEISDSWNYMSHLITGVQNHFSHQLRNGLTSQHEPVKKVVLACSDANSSLESISEVSKAVSDSLRKSADELFEAYGHLHTGGPRVVDLGGPNASS